MLTAPALKRSMSGHSKLFDPLDWFYGIHLDARGGCIHIVLRKSFVKS